MLTILLTIKAVIVLSLAAVILYLTVGLLASYR
jgi:hypothetical protein